MRTETRNNAALWFAVVGGPLAWSVDTLAAISIDHDYCAHGATGTSGAVPLAALVGISIVAAILAIASGMSGWRFLTDAGTDNGLGDTVDDRRRFMARFGVVISILALFGIVLRMITVLFVSPALC